MKEVDEDMRHSKTIQKFVVLLAIALFVCAPVFAGPIEALNLSDQQVQAARNTLRTANVKIARIESEMQGSSNPWKLKDDFKEIRTIRAEALQEIRGSLTPSQQASFDQWTTKLQQKRESRKEMMQSLNLTRQQKIQIAKITEESKSAVWKLLAERTSSPAEIKNQVRQLHQAAAQKIRQQLTADQAAKFDAWKQQNAHNTL